jgi:DNA (cytosine-5)-methyltransferase 1
MENVGAITFRGLADVVGSLAEIGYDAEWQDVRAEDVGAPHRRERIWIVAYPNSEGERGLSVNAEMAGASKLDVPDPNGRRCEQCHAGERRLPELNPHREATPNPDSKPTQRSTESRGQRGHWSIEPDVGRLAHGVPRRVDRLRGDGNAIVPQIAAMLFETINTF